MGKGILRCGSLTCCVTITWRPIDSWTILSAANWCWLNGGVKQTYQFQTIRLSINNQLHPNSTGKNCPSRTLYRLTRFCVDKQTDCHLIYRLTLRMSVRHSWSVVRLHSIARNFSIVTQSQPHHPQMSHRTARSCKVIRISNVNNIQNLKSTRFFLPSRRWAWFDCSDEIIIFFFYPKFTKINILNKHLTFIVIFHSGVLPFARSELSPLARKCTLAIRDLRMVCPAGPASLQIHFCLLFEIKILFLNFLLTRSQKLTSLKTSWGKNKWKIKKKFAILDSAKLIWKHFMRLAVEWLRQLITFEE